MNWPRRLRSPDRLPADSAYAKAHGRDDVLNTGSDPKQVLREFLAGDRETLRLVAQNTIQMSQEIAEQQLPEENRQRVVQAVTRLCREKLGQEIEITQSDRQEQSRKRGYGIGI